MRGNTIRVSVVASFMFAMVALSGAPAFGHGENDARPLARGTAIGPYTASVWQVIGDQGSELPSHMIVTFDGAGPSVDDALSIVLAGETRRIEGRRLDNGSWETAEVVAFGTTFTVELATVNAEWVSAPIVAPQPPSAHLPMRPIMSIALFLTTAMAMWLGRRAKRAWTAVPAPYPNPTT